MGDSVSFDILFKTGSAEADLKKFASTVDTIIGRVEKKFSKLDVTSSRLVKNMRVLGNNKFRGFNKGLQSANKQMAMLEKKMRNMNSMSGGGRRSGGGGNRFASGAMGMMGGIGAFGLMGMIGGVPAAGNKMQSTMADIDGILDSSKKNYSGLRDEILKTGKASAFTITQMAGAAKYMAMAGMGGKDISNTLGSVGNMAMVGNLDVDRSADIMTNIMAGMGIKSKSSGAVTDVITGVMTSTNVSIEELGQSFAYVGNIAAQTGRSVDEVGVAVGILGDAGIKGSRAGTNLRQMFLKLAAPTAKASSLMKSLNVSIYEIGKSGKRQLKPISELLTEFKDSGAGLAEFKEIFGVRGGAAFSALLSGADKYSSVLKKIKENGGGLTQSLAEKKMATTAGKTMVMQSKWEALSIVMMEKVRPAYDYVIEGIGRLFDKLSSSDKFLNLIETIANTIAKAFKVAYVLGKALFGFIVDNGDTILTVLMALGAAMATFAMYSAAATLINPFSAMLIAGAGVLAMIDDINGKADYRKNAPDGAILTSELADRYRGRLNVQAKEQIALGQQAFKEHGVGASAPFYAKARELRKMGAVGIAGIGSQSDQDVVNYVQKDWSFHKKQSQLQFGKKYLRENTPEGRMKKYTKKYLGGNMSAGSSSETVLGQLGEIFSKDLVNLGGLKTSGAETKEGDTVGTLSSPLTSVANQMSRSVVVNMEALMKVEKQYIGTSGGELSTEDIQTQLADALTHLVRDYELGMSN